MNRTYIAIDLKSYYASAECAARRLDPLSTNLVVADTSRSEKTICLAVSPSLKAYGIPGRARLFEVVQAVNNINAARLAKAVKLGAAIREADGKPGFSAVSCDARELARDPSLRLGYIAATPRMSYYIQTSAKIYNIYTRYIAADDILVYSIDEIFFDATDYLALYHLSAHDLAKTMIRDVLYATGITATAGIGTNLYLAKIAMDIVAKHIPADQDGVRIASLTEESFRYLLWDHKPITDFWRIAGGTARRLARYGVRTMGELARLSVQNEDLLYREFGVDAEILIDHAWGIEPVRMEHIKAYQPSTTNYSEGQVLAHPTSFADARVILAEMADNIIYRLTDTRTVTNGLQIYIGYDRENAQQSGQTHLDHYGRAVPQPAAGTIRLRDWTMLGSEILPAILAFYDRYVNRRFTIRRMFLTAIRVRPDDGFHQLDLFSDTQKEEREQRLQEAMLSVRKRYGKNLLLKGRDYLEGANIRERNEQIGGHKA